MKLLLDENISPAVAQRLAAAGVDACHVRDRALLGATDAQVLARAYGEDRVLVTANVVDFERLARSVEVHPGIILLRDGAMTRDEQYDAIVRALAIRPGEPCALRGSRRSHELHRSPSELRSTHGRSWEGSRRRRGRSGRRNERQEVDAAHPGRASRGRAAGAATTRLHERRRACTS